MKTFIKKFNILIKKIIFKVENITNNKSQISNFNKYLITFISLLFFYLFYLSIPILYNKLSIQNNIENQLSKEFGINFSVSSDITYRILPAPHFLFKDSKIFKNGSNKTVSLADVKNLRIFISQKNFLNKKKITIKHIKIDNANFSMLKGDLKFFKDLGNEKFSKKKVEITKSNIFFKDNLNNILAFIKVSKAIFLLDDKNLFKLKGKIFNMPFSFDFFKKFDSSEEEEINIIVKKLRLNILDTYKKKENNIDNREVFISFLNSIIVTDYKIDNGIVVFKSNGSKINTDKIDYNGELSINPFDLNLNVNIDNLKIFKILNVNSILTELIKTKLLFNENISINTSLTTNSPSQQKLFHKTIINFVINNGKIKLDKTKLFNEKIGTLELDNSNFFLKNERLILNTDIIVNIKNNDKLFSLLQTSKRFRKPVKKILVNLNYDFLSDQIEFNNFKIDNKKASDKLLDIIEDFGDNSSNNWIKSKATLNTMFEAYEG
jgi:hypothetical protein